MSWDQIKQVAQRAAKKAGQMLRAGLTHELTIAYKGDSNLVTQMDLLAEKEIIAVIDRHFKDHQILAEEGGARQSDSAYRWIIDPLDGTTNYAHRFPYFCVSIAVEFERVVHVGVIYDPIRNELFVAERGKGATLNNRPIGVSSCARLNEALLVTGFAYNLRTDTDNNIDHFQKFLMRAQGIRRMGSAALDLCYVASGRFDGFWELHLNPWDTAAGSLILTEAGGSVTTFSGNPFFLESREILATNKKIHQPMVDLFLAGK